MDFKVLKQPKVFVTTIVNILGLLENVDVINALGITHDTAMKFVWVIVFLAVQFGIMNKPNDPSIIGKITEMEDMDV